MRTFSKIIVYINRELILGNIEEEMDMVLADMVVVFGSKLSGDTRLY
jgi:hypothetical protein